MLVVMTGHLKSDFDVSLDGLFERVFLNVDKATNFTYNDQSSVKYYLNIAPHRP